MHEPPLAEDSKVSKDTLTDLSEFEVPKKGIIASIKSDFAPKFPDDFSIAEGRASVITIAWPALLESFLLNLASMVNTMMVGGLGTWAIASVGYSSQPRLLITAVFQAFNTGATALIARAKGAEKPEEANIIMHQAVLFSMTVSVLLAFLGYLFAEPMVIFMGANEELTIAGATEYFKIIMLTFPANAFSLAVTAMLRGIGQTRASMIYNVTANVINVFLGFLLIHGRFGFPALGVRGAAIGLGVGQVVAMFIAFITVLHGTDMLKLSLKLFLKIDLGVLQRILRIGTPAMFEQLCMRAGNIMFSRIVASLGTDAFATHQIAMNIHQMTFMNGQAFGVSATSLLGQSMGRKRPDQGKALVQLCRRYALYLSLTIAAVLVVCGRPLVALYTEDPGIIAMGAMLMWIVAILQPLQSSQQVLAGALRGAGDTKAVAICIFIGIVVIRPVMSYVLVNGFGLGLIGIWLSLGMDQSTRSAYTLWRFASDRWITVKV
ncbi:MAG: MATE family efflux transporter [Symbiobacteriaceae bacterium]|nr:MATE family efflux transporter [Symbiobacteriaceae bacterium]